MKTKQELKQIANDLYNNKIFTDRHLKNSEDLLIVFPVLLFLNDEQKKDILSGKVAMIYSYISDSSNASVNGYPICLSCNTLSKEEYKTVVDYYRKIKTAIESIK